MQGQGTRRSDRIALQLAIIVSGADAMGYGFVEQTHTLVLSRHGAKILLARMLVPEQEITVRLRTNGREADVRVVGQIGAGPAGPYYGIEFLDPQINLWDIEFPPLSDCEQAVARVLLECVRCHTRELSYLNEFEAEVFEANKVLSRPCKRCTDMSLWKPSGAPAPQAPPPQPVNSHATPEVPPARTQNERKQVRVSLRMKACVRTAQFGDDIGVTENVSRDGFSFKSAKRYGIESLVEACVPYSPGAGNIFSPARIEHADPLADEGVTSYGVGYIRIHKGWPEK